MQIRPAVYGRVIDHRVDAMAVQPPSDLIAITSGNSNRVLMKHMPLTDDWRDDARDAMEQFIIAFGSQTPPPVPFVHMRQLDPQNSCLQTV